MKKKFGSYTINICDKKSHKNPDGTITLEVILSGCIEIGLEIEEYTWRKDWLLQLFFKDKYMNYRVVSIENDDKWTNNPLTEINKVKAIVKPW